MVSAKKHQQKLTFLLIDYELCEKLGLTIYNYLVDKTYEFADMLSKIEINDSTYRFYKHVSFPEYKNRYIFPEITDFENGMVTINYVDLLLSRYNIELDDFLDPWDVERYHKYKNRIEDVFEEENASKFLEINEPKEYIYPLKNLKDYFNDTVSDKYNIQEIRRLSKDFDKLNEEIKRDIETEQTKKDKHETKKEAKEQRKAEREARKLKKAQKQKKEKELQERRLKKQKEEEEEKKRVEEERLAQEKREKEARMEKIRAQNAKKEEERKLRQERHEEVKAQEEERQRQKMEEKRQIEDQKRKEEEEEKRRIEIENRIKEAEEEAQRKLDEAEEKEREAQRKIREAEEEAQKIIEESKLEALKTAREKNEIAGSIKSEDSSTTEDEAANEINSPKIGLEDLEKIKELKENIDAISLRIGEETDSDTGSMILQLEDIGNYESIEKEFLNLQREVFPCKKNADIEFGEDDGFFGDMFYMSNSQVSNWPPQVTSIWISKSFGIHNQEYHIGLCNDPRLRSLNKYQTPSIESKIKFRFSAKDIDKNDFIFARDIATDNFRILIKADLSELSEEEQYVLSQKELILSISDEDDEKERFFIDLGEIEGRNFSRKLRTLLVNTIYTPSADEDNFFKISEVFENLETETAFGKYREEVKPTGIQIRDIIPEFDFKEPLKTSARVYKADEDMSQIIEHMNLKKEFYAAKTELNNFLEDLGFDPKTVNIDFIEKLIKSTTEPEIKDENPNLPHPESNVIHDEESGDLSDKGTIGLTEEELEQYQELSDELEDYLDDEMDDYFDSDEDESNAIADYSALSEDEKIKHPELSEKLDAILESLKELKETRELEESSIPDVKEETEILDNDDEDDFDDAPRSEFDGVPLGIKIANKNELLKNHEFIAVEDDEYINDIDEDESILKIENQIQRVRSSESQEYLIHQVVQLIKKGRSIEKICETLEIDNEEFNRWREEGKSGNPMYGELYELSERVRGKSSHEIKAEEEIRAKLSLLVISELNFILESNDIDVSPGTKTYKTNQILTNIPLNDISASLESLEDVKTKEKRVFDLLKSMNTQELLKFIDKDIYEDYSHKSKTEIIEKIRSNLELSQVEELLEHLSKKTEVKRIKKQIPKKYTNLNKEKLLEIQSMTKEILEYFKPKEIVKKEILKDSGFNEIEINHPLWTLTEYGLMEKTGSDYKLSDEETIEEFLNYEIDDFDMVFKNLDVLKFEKASTVEFLIKGVVDNIDLFDILDQLSKYRENIKKMVSSALGNEKTDILIEMEVSKLKAEELEGLLNN